MSNNDEVFAGDADIDEQFRSRTTSSYKPRYVRSRSHKSGHSSHALDRNDEEEPLLETGAGAGAGTSSRGRAGSNGEGEPEEWFGTAELKGLPWWKKPSVREELGHNLMADADGTLIRYSGYCLHSSCSRRHMVASLCQR
jgi:hypothetical protein